eukprot:7065398-Prymnesium_polylepis.1
MSHVHVHVACALRWPRPTGSIARVCAQVRLDAAEERLREALSMRDGAVNERQAVEQALAVERIERRKAEEGTSRAEATVKEAARDKGAVAVRAENAEARCAELLAQRDAAIEERSQVVAKLAAVQAEKAGVAELLGRADGEKQELAAERR